MSQTCEHIQERIPDALSGRLDVAALAELESHCEICAECRALYGSFEQTAQILERAFPASSGARPELWERIEASVAAKSARFTAPKVIPIWGPLAAAAAMFALAVLLFAGSPARQAESPIAIANPSTKPLEKMPKATETKVAKVEAPAPAAIMLVTERGPREVIDDTLGLALLRATGPVFSFDAGHQAWRQVVSGERIAYGAAVRTAPGALAELAFGESRVRVDEKSEVAIVNSTTSTARVAELTRGRVRVDLLHSERPFQIRSGGGTVELTGTVVDVDAPAADLAFVQVLEGHVKVTPVTHQELTSPISVVAGQQALVSSRINDTLLKSLPEAVQARLRALSSPQALGRETANWSEALDHPPSPKNSAVGQLIVKDEQGRDAEPLRIVGMSVNTQVRGPESITRIDQSFYNSTPSTLEGTFYFNVPPGAAISRFAMYVDEKNLIEGEVVERGRARAIYESILHAKRDPALLEWVDGNTFKARVFPIAARSNKRIIMEYTQVLPAFFDTRRYVFPLVSDLASKAEIGKLDISVELDTGDGSNFTEIASPPYARQLQLAGAGESRATASLSLEHVRPSADFVLNFTAPRPSELFASAFAENGEQPYVLLGYQPRLPAATQRDAKAPGRDILFVAETSGARTVQDLAAQRQALAAMLAALNDDDRVAFAAADVGLVRLTPNFIPARAADADAALLALKNRVALGALDLSACIGAAANVFDETATDPQRQRMVVFIGSGVAALGELDGGKIAADGAAALAKAHAAFVAVSLGQSVDALTLSELARRSNGFYLPLKADEGLDAAAFQLALSLQTPLLTSPLFMSAPESTDEIFPVSLGALLPGQEVFLHTRAIASKAGAPSVLHFTLTAELLKQPYRSTFTVALPSELSADPAAGRFWARARLDHLLAKPQDGEVRREVIDLAKAWTLMSPYTSFLVLESNDEYKRYDIDRSKRRAAWRDLDAKPVVVLTTGQTSIDFNTERQNLIETLTNALEKSGSITFEKRANALVIRDPAAEAEKSFQSALKSYDNLNYADAKRGFELAVALDPSNGAALRKLQVVDSLLKINVDKIAAKIRTLEASERVKQTESLVQLAQAVQDATALEERAKKLPELMDERDKAKVLGDQLDDLRKSRDKFHRVKEILSWLPPSMSSEQPQENALVTDALKRTRQEINDKEDELNYLRRVAAQREADSARVRGTELFKARIGKLNDQVKDLYDRGDYDSADRLAKRILEIDPYNAEAASWRKKASEVVRKRKDTVDDSTVLKKGDEDIDQVTIGYAPIILYPSNWDQITKRVDDLSRSPLAGRDQFIINNNGTIFQQDNDKSPSPPTVYWVTPVPEETHSPYQASPVRTPPDASPAEIKQLKAEIEELRTKLKSSARSGSVSTALTSKYGPNATVTTKNGELSIGGLVSTWYSAPGFFDSADTATPDALDNSSFRIRRGEMKFAPDIHENAPRAINGLERPWVDANDFKLAPAPQPARNGTIFGFPFSVRNSEAKANPSAPKETGPSADDVRLEQEDMIKYLQMKYSTLDSDSKELRAEDLNEWIATDPNMRYSIYSPSNPDENRAHAPLKSHSGDERLGIHLERLSESPSDTSEKMIKKVSRASEELTRALNDEALKRTTVDSTHIPGHSDEKMEVRDDVEELSSDTSETTGRKEVAIAAKDAIIHRQETLIAQEKAEKDALAEQNKALADQNLLLVEKNAKSIQSAPQSEALAKKVKDQDDVLSVLETKLSVPKKLPESPKIARSTVPLLNLRPVLQPRRPGAIDPIKKVEAQPEPELRIYDISDLIGADYGVIPAEPGQHVPTAASLSDAVKTRVVPQSWDAAKGTSVEEMAGRLVVMQDPKVHEAIETYIAACREKLRADIAAGRAKPPVQRFNDFPGRVLSKEYQGLDNNVIFGDYGGISNLGTPNGPQQPRRPGASDATPADAPFPAVTAGPLGIAGGTFSTVGSIVNHRINYATNDHTVISSNDATHAAQPDPNGSNIFESINAQLKGVRNTQHAEGFGSVPSPNYVAPKHNAERDARQEALTKLATAENEKGRVLAENQKYIKNVQDSKDTLNKQRSTDEIRHETSELETELERTRQTLVAVKRDKELIEGDLKLQTSRIDQLIKSGVPVANVLSEPPAKTESAVPEKPAAPAPGKLTGAPSDTPELARLRNELNDAKLNLARTVAEKHAVEDKLAEQTSRVERLLKNGVPIAHLLGEDSAAAPSNVADNKYHETISRSGVLIAQLFGEDPTATQPFMSDGRVLGVKPEIKVVMLSLGSEQGVKPGFQFVIKRGDQYITRVIVEKIYPDMSSAHFIDGRMNKQGLEVQINDEVITANGSSVAGDAAAPAPAGTAPVYLTRDQLATLLETLPKTAATAAGRADVYRKLAAVSAGAEAVRVLAQGLAEFHGEGPQAEVLATDIVTLVDTESKAATLDAMLPLLNDENLRAHLLARRGAVETDPDRRCEFLAAAYETSGKDLSYLQPLALALQQAGQHAQLITRLESSLRSGNSGGGAAQNWMWPLLTTSYLATGDAAGALRAGSQRVALQPREAEPRIDFARALDAQGRGAEAIREMRAACNFAPERIDVLRAFRDLAVKYADAEAREWALLTLLRNDWGADSQKFWAEARTELDGLKAGLRQSGNAAHAAELERRQQEADATDIVAVMSWNTDHTDIDLHVEEPGQQRVSYNSRSSFRGGNLDDDNTSGFGPETYTLRHAPEGRYIIKVHYYAGEPPTDVTVKVTRHQGGTGESTETFHIRLEKAHDEQIVETIEIPKGN